MVGTSLRAPRHQLVAGLSLALWTLVAIAQPVQFANGDARITLPDGYGHELEETGKTIAIRPAQRTLFTFRLTYHSLAQYARDQPYIAEDFIRAVAEKRGLKANRIRGSDSVGFIERGGESMVNGEPARNMQGVLSLGKGYVTLTLTVPEKYAQRQEVRAFVAGGMEGLLGSLRAGEM
jgi:hypothetical protein